VPYIHSIPNGLVLWALDKAAAHKAFGQLPEFVSEDENSTAQVLLEGLEWKSDPFAFPFNLPSQNIE
jgi:hypothetical protein